MKNQRTLFLSALLFVALVGASTAATSTFKQYDTDAKKGRLTAKVPKYSPVHQGGTVGINQPLPDAPPVPISPIGPAEVGQSDALCQSGAAKATKGDWAGASSDYAQALALWPDSKEALYGAARCAAGMSDVPSALDYYRRAIYMSAPFPYVRKLREPYAFRSMPFALLLNEAGQAAEAVSVYNQVVGLLNHEGGKEHALEADLPEFGDGPGQVLYSPQGLEAMAHLAIGIDTFSHEGYGDPEPLANFQQALALAPDSAAANYYLGHYWYGKGWTHNPEAKAYLDKAVQLGDDRTVQAAKNVLQYIH